MCTVLRYWYTVRTAAELCVHTGPIPMYFSALTRTAYTLQRPMTGTDVAESGAGSNDSCPYS